MSEQDAELFELFIKELEEHLETLESGLLELEKNCSDPNEETVNEVFRACHSIKGAAGFFGYEGIRELSHSMENAFDEVRNQSLALDSGFIDLMLHCLDCLKQGTDNPGDPSDASVFSDEISRINRIVNGEDAPDEVSEISETETTSEKPVEKTVFAVDEKLKQEASRFGKKIYGITIRPGDDLYARNRTVDGFLGDLRDLGDIISSEPDIESIVKTKSESRKVVSEFNLVFETVLEYELLLQALDMSDEQVVLLFPEEKASPENERAAAEKTTAQDEGKAESAPLQNRTARQYIRVRTDLLDDLMKAAGELVLSRNQLLEQFRGEPGYRSIVQGIDRITTELQSRIMQTRLQPLKTLFKKYPRMVRDIAAELSKNIELEIQGDDVELDSSIIENLSDPLNHIIRNACDHGIESSEERIASGKIGTGRLTIDAYYEGEQVVIEIRDNGRGINREKIRQRIFEKGLATDEELARMNKSELFSYIFKPGFSTAEQVSGISGRGVGMDVVLTNIKNLGGEVFVDSEEGKGSRIRLVLPLTIAITPALIVRTEEHVFAINQSDVVDIMNLKSTYTEKKIEKVRGVPVLRREGNLLPLLFLADVLDIPRTYVDPDSGTRLPDRRESIADRRSRELADEIPESDEEKQTESFEDKRKNPDRRKSNEVLVVVVRYQNNSFGLIVNEVIGMEEIVVKPLPMYIRTPLYSGTTIRGEGNVVLILNTNSIAQKGGLRFGEAEEIAEKEQLSDAAAGIGDEAQDILLCRISEDIKVGLHMDVIQRVEDIRECQIRSIEGVSYACLNGKNIRIIPCSEQIADNNRLPVNFLLIPRMNSSIGFGVNEIIDFLQVSVILDTESIRSKTVFGTVNIGGENVLVPDVFAIADRYNGGSGGNAKPFSEKKVLLVEDTQFYREIERRYMEEGFCTVECASNGAEALVKLNSDRYDLVACDLRMPVMDGFGLVHEMKAHPELQNLPVLALTNLNEKEEIEEETDCFSEYAVKTNRDELLRKTRELVGSTGI